MFKILSLLVFSFLLLKPVLVQSKSLPSKKKRFFQWPQKAKKKAEDVPQIFVFQALIKEEFIREAY